MTNARRARQARAGAVAAAIAPRADQQTGVAVAAPPGRSALSLAPLSALPVDIADWLRPHTNGPYKLTGRVFNPPHFPIRAGQEVAYRWVPTQELPREHVAIVVQEVRRAARLTRLGGDLFLRFYRATDGPGDFTVRADVDDEILNGVVRGDWPGGTIGILADLRGAEAVRAVVLEEVRHLAQLAIVGMLLDEDISERDAKSFAAAHLRSED